MELYGDLHTHTLASDGCGTVEDNIAAAAAAGLKQVAITDHGHGKLCGRMKPEEYVRQKAQIVKAGEQHNIQALFGVEANIIGVGGEIDISGREQGEFDILLCGIHRGVRPKNWKTFFTFFLPNYFWKFIRWTPKCRIKKNTRVVINAIEKNNIDILVHPGRYFCVNVLDIARVCIERGTVMELNAKKISFRPIDFERMSMMGAKFVIGSDAHSPENVGRTDRVEEFLKLCDYNPECIINMDKPFVRPKSKIMENIIKEENGSADTGG
jgi:putative hydrolase